MPPPAPVIPDPVLLPPPTVPSAPQRFFPPLAPAVGAPAAVFQFRPTITVSEEYSDNFFLTERDRESNFRTTVSPGLRLDINSPFTKGTIAYSFAPAHDTVTDDFGLFHSLLGQVSWNATPLWTLTLADTLTRSDQPVEADRLGLRRERQKFTTNNLFLTSDYLLGTVITQQSYRWNLFTDEDGGETSSHILGATASVPVLQTNFLTAGYEYLTSTTSGGDGNGTIRSNGEDTETRGHRFSASASRRLTAVTTVGVSGSYALRDVESDFDKEDFTIWNASVFGTYSLPGRLTLNTTLGVSGAKADSGETLGPNFSTVTRLSYHFARAIASLTFDKGFSETFAEGENFGLVETEAVTGSLSYLFTPALSGTGTGFFRRNKTTGIADDTAVDRNERTENWGGSLGFTLRLRKVFFDLTYSYIRQLDKGRADTEDSYTENRVRLAVTVSF